MKKVLKLVLVLAMLVVLSVSAFAAPISPTWYVAENNSGAAELVLVRYLVDDTDYTVDVVPADAAAAAANQTAAGSLANGGSYLFLDSFDIIVKKGGEVVHEGATLEITLSIPAEHLDDYLALIENTDGAVTVAYSAPVNGKATVTFTLTKFSTFTPVLIGAPVSAGTSPQTSQSIVPVALICVAGMALIAVVIATKRKFN